MNDTDGRMLGRVIREERTMRAGRARKDVTKKRKVGHDCTTRDIHA